MQRLEVSGAVRPIYGSLGVKRLIPSVCVCVSAANCPPKPDETCLLSYDFPDLTGELYDTFLR